ncbi:TonB family protein [Candidatus Latescibacterota bacterium]
MSAAMYEQELSLTRRTYIVSVLLHLALVIWMVNTDILIEVPIPPFFEISMGTVSRQRIEQIIDEAVVQRQQALTPEERITVPERRMLEIEEPTLSVPTQRRLESRDIVTSAARLTTELEAPRIDMPAPPPDLLVMDRKQSFQGSRITTADLTGAGIETGVIGAEVAINFTIEGEIEGRQVLVNPLPSYPEGLNQNATIQLSFAVLPDGTVSSAGMVPVRKENAVLEELAMNSLRLWRFSPLLPGNERTQRGVITFIFEVR